MACPFREQVIVFEALPWADAARVQKGAEPLVIPRAN
jgi:hypothetical protein